jgi:hypothetical protein
MNQSRAETLRRRIEVYRRCLHDRETSDPTLVSVYLSEIAKAEVEIAELEKTGALYIEGNRELRTPSLVERQKAAAEARQQALERYRARISEPELAERQAARRAVASAREIRIAERKAAKEAAEKAAKEEAERRTAEEAAEIAAKEEAERAAREEARQAEIAARQAAAEAKAARQRELEAELLNTRKVRKAARKAKKRGR